MVRIPARGEGAPRRGHRRAALRARSRLREPARRDPRSSENGFGTASDVLAQARFASDNAVPDHLQLILGVPSARGTLI